MRDHCSRVFGPHQSHETSLNLLEMMDAAAAGKLKALWAIGYDIALTNANATATEHALGVS
jgi:formate dehydrogenase major subunit